MKRKKTIVRAIIVLTSIAMVGLIAVQIYLFDNAIEQREFAFEQNVNAALSTVVQNLETREAASVLFEVDTDGENTEHHAITTFKVKGQTERDTVSTWLSAGDEPSVEVDSNHVVLFLPKSKHVRLTLLDPSGVEVQNLLDKRLPAGRNEVPIIDSLVADGTFGIRMSSDSLIYIAQFARDRQQTVRLPATTQGKRMIVNRVLDDLTKLQRLSITERVDRDLLDSLLTTTLVAKDIRTPFEYGIMTQQSDSLLLASRSAEPEKIVASQFQSRLFPNELFSARYILSVYFPAKQSYLLREVMASAIISFLFILILILSFIYIVRGLFKQREFSNRLTNFINNMTHEFKTPITTIALASESMTLQKTKSASIRKYASMIQDENKRMQRQVEKILQMAALEEGEFELNPVELDLHKTIASAVEKVSLQIEKRKGSVATTLQAEPHVIQGDEFHISNIILNLLDNAIKYTRGAPQIRVATKNSDAAVHVEIADNGIGLHPEEQSKVFDKYYRVSTGDVHDVKGFGLGLSYVKLMVDAHGGEVKVVSAPGKGSIFELTFPLTKNGER